ncbi:15476_t:CDS:2, partial [Funneliformis geosporum]
MLKVGTVFSGIGAFEQALKRMNINHDILFACDNDRFVKQSYFANYDIDDNRNIKDKRGLLVYQFIRLIKEIKPKVFIFENVKDYGIPQNRQRLFVVGLLEENGFKFPLPIPLVIKMKDLLEDRENSHYFLPEKGIKFVLDKKNQQKRYTQGTANYRTTIETDLEVARPLLSTMTKCHRAGVDNYITEGSKIRKLTPRECLRLMGFPDTFKIVVSDTQMYKQAGNIVNGTETTIADSFVKKNKTIRGAKKAHGEARLYQLEKIEEEFLYFNFEDANSVDDKARFYIRSKDKTFWDLFRSLVLPIITSLSIAKVELNISKESAFYFYPYLHSHERFNHPIRIRREIEKIRKDPTLDETVKKQLINSRRGQGRFRKRITDEFSECVITK